jgi:hypothetical protein
MHSADIVGYQYNADLYCPGCIIDVLPTGAGEAFDGWALAVGVTMSVEADLREIAFAFSINYDDPESYDSDEFPKPVLCVEASTEDTCGKCHELLMESDDDMEDDEGD